MSALVRKRRTRVMHPKQITLGEMRSNDGPRRLIVCCGDYSCAHSVIINAERWPDRVRLSDLEYKFVCEVCGHRGADISEWSSGPWDNAGMHRERLGK